MMNKSIVTQQGDKVCMVVVLDGKVSQLMLEPDTADSLLGNIYIGKVQKAVSNIDAAFIDMGPGCVGYYSLQERWRPECLRTGDELVVQVSKDVVKSKTPVVTERLSFTEWYCMLTVGKTGIGFSAKIHDASYETRLRELLERGLAGIKDLGIIVRANAITVEECTVREEPAELMRTWQRLSAEAGCGVCYGCFYRALLGYIVAIRDSFSGTLGEITTNVLEYHRELKTYLETYQKEGAGCLTLYEDNLLPLDKLYSLETVSEKALGKNAWLKSEGCLVIESTEAMTVIDVNTGRYSGRKKVQDTTYKVNVETADEIGRQIRLYNLSGTIIVDFTDIERREDRKALLTHLIEVVSRDPVRTTAVDMVTLNLAELTRKKVRKPLHKQV